MRTPLRLIWILGFLVATNPTGAAPKPKPPAAKQELTPELIKFAGEMAASFDGVYIQVAATQKLEAAGKFPEAAAGWQGIYQGAMLLIQHARLAGAAGSFRDPMTFQTKAGKLTPATFLKQLEKLQASGDVGWAKATERANQIKAKQAGVTYVASIAAQVTSLEAIAKQATTLIRSKPEAARVAMQNVARGAAAVRTSVTSAAKLKRAPSNASYPVKPKALSASDLSARLSLVEKDARAVVAEIDKTLAARAKPAAAKPAATKPPATVSTKPGNNGGGSPAVAPQNTTPVAAEPEAPVCSPPGETHCDDTNMHAPCCEGTRCLPAGWVTNGTDAGGFPTVEPEYYACQDPDLAPKH